ncbi:hypothetical protein [Alloprevotella tannerae]|uniref:hypothetical protein n=1 Tax=Alloprevotella tannerae TaxID=76122 RepID=UPI00288A08D3|nr:hypothetical protein [Alloprevotella tannerae]
MNNIILRTAVKQAEAVANRLSISLQEVERHLVFRGFQEDDTPQVTICNGDEIIAVYNGSEIDAPTFIKIMEEVGYITKDDFIL